MSKLYMFLSCLIPGPHNPKDDIDVYLNPLIDDLKKLWSGVLTYDISRKQNLMMRATLMQTTNDFPAYGMLSSWETSGRMACLHCMKDKRVWGGGGITWFGSHHRFLPDQHTFRTNKSVFIKAKDDRDGPPNWVDPQSSLIQN